MTLQLSTDISDLEAEGGATTPAGLQSTARIARRRWLMLALNIATLATLAWGLADVLSAGGWTLIDIGLFATFLLSAPWMILGFWNAAIGLWLLRLRSDGLARTSPFLDALEGPEPAPAGRIAVAMTLRNEDPERAFARLLAMRADLDSGGDGARYDVFVLSDSDQPEILAAETALFARHRARLDGAGRATYRRRAENTAWKAGNVADFLARWGDGYAYLLPLDADSLMSAAAIRRLARIMDRTPKLGILQSLCVGAPAESGFARLFQFGMRHGMRAFTMGSAWWQADCGPYWGHNALIRIAPFKAQCKLPVLPGAPPLGGHILSHDQVEATLMRRAGYEVRVMPVEGESWEDNPVTLLDFIRREKRWCTGNMQYFRLLSTPGLRPVSRFQLFQAIMMYLGAPAWMAMTVLAATKALTDDLGLYDGGLAVGLFATMFFMSLAPKLAGFVDIALEPGAVARYGGVRAFGLGAALEIGFSMLMAPAVALSLTILIIGLPFGRRLGWNGQTRDAYRVGWGEAWRGLWPQMLLGAAVAAALWIGAPQVVPWAAPVLLGLILAAPFAVATSTPGFGRWLRRRRLARVPEELAPPPILRASRAALPIETDAVDAPMTRLAQAVRPTPPQTRRQVS